MVFPKKPFLDMEKKREYNEIICISLFGRNLFESFFPCCKNYKRDDPLRIFFSGGGSMKKEHLVFRVFLLVLGLVIMAYGVALSIQAGLGTSPISSLPYTVSQFSPLTVGTATIAMHVCFILFQILLLRRKYRVIQLLQLPVALLFGYLTDLTLQSIQNLVPTTYIEQWIFCLLGIILVGIGVSCEVNANVIPLAGEGFSLAICEVFSFPFHPVKIGFDCTLVLLSCVLGLVFQGQITGVREGTVAAAIFVGLVSKQATKWIIGPLTKRFCS